MHERNFRSPAMSCPHFPFCSVEEQEQDAGRWIDGRALPFAPLHRFAVPSLFFTFCCWPTLFPATIPMLLSHQITIAPQPSPSVVLSLPSFLPPSLPLPQSTSFHPPSVISEYSLIPPYGRHVTSASAALDSK